MRNLLLVLAALLALASPSEAQTRTGAVNYQALPSCVDTGGNHLNYTPATGAISCGSSGPALTINHNPAYSWCAGCTVVNETLRLIAPTYAGTVHSVTYATGGGGGATFTVALQIAGTPVTGCSAITVTSSTLTTTNCTALNTFTSGQELTLAITGAANSPASALFQVNFVGN